MAVGVLTTESTRPNAEVGNADEFAVANADASSNCGIIGIFRKIYKMGELQKDGVTFLQPSIESC